MPHILYIGIFFSIFSILFIISKRPLTKSSIAALIFQFLLAFPFEFKLIMLRIIAFPYHDYSILLINLVFLYGPLLYFYVRFEINKKDILKKIDFLHLIPFIFFIIWKLSCPIPAPLIPITLTANIENNTQSFISMIEKTTQDKNIRVNLQDEISDAKIELDERIRERSISARIFKIFSILSLILYSFFTFKLISYNKQFYSSNVILNRMRNLQFLTLSFVAIYSFVAITIFTTEHKLLDPLRDRHILTDIATSLFIIIFCFFIVVQSILSERQLIEETQASKKGRHDKKYERSGLKDSEAENYMNILENFMISEKPYLNCDLTIKDLSDKLDIPRHYLTQIINEKLNKNFFTYITEYRIKEVKKLMQDKNCSDYTILRIAYQSGFNSKSKFNTAFKQITGYTPSEYKKIMSDKMN